MRITISIATMNSRGRLEACLATLPAACGDLSWRAVVVDNGSVDGTAAMVRERFPAVELRRNDRPLGFGANHNQVLRTVVSDGDDDHAALVLNDDTELDPGSVRALVDALRAEPRAGAVSPSVIGADGVRQPMGWRSTPLPLAVLSAFTGRSAARASADRADWLSGCCLLIPRTVLRDVGLFDERFFMYAEDVDLTLRIAARGLRLWECGESRIVHHGGATTGQPVHASAMRLQAERSFFLLLVKTRGPRVAAAVSAAFRASHALWGVALTAVGRVTGDDRRRASGAARLRLARYDPRVPVFPDRERPPDGRGGPS